MLNLLYHIRTVNLLGEGEAALALSGGLTAHKFDNNSFEPLPTSRKASSMARQLWPTKGPYSPGDDRSPFRS